LSWYAGSEAGVRRDRRRGDRRVGDRRFLLPAAVHRQQRDSIRDVLVRSTLAATGSGLGFYAISGIWFPFDPHGWDYARHFVSWTIAYLPGFAALLYEKR
jgi:hypothetical protein